MQSKLSIRDEGTFGLAAWSGQSRGMLAAHQHLDLEINYVLSGTMRYLVGGRIAELPSQRLCLLWGGVPHQMIRDRQIVEAIWVTVPLASVLGWGLPDLLTRPLLATGFIADPAPRPGDIALLHQWLDDLVTFGRRPAIGSEAAPVCRIVLLEIEARLRRLALELSHLSNQTEGISVGSNATTHSDQKLVAVEAMAQFISRNFQNNIGVTEIAEPAHLHPNYAMTLFRGHTGMTISQYLTLQRVAHAQRLLVTTSETIPDIAISSGFGSVSRFYEAFRQQTGNSPRRFRLHLPPATG